MIRESTFDMNKQREVVRFLTKIENNYIGKEKSIYKTIKSFNEKQMSFEQTYLLNTQIPDAQLPMDLVIQINLKFMVRDDSNASK